MTPTELITRVYIGYFDRVPDTAGLDYWLELYVEGTSLETIVRRFAAAPETIALYGNLDQAQQQLDRTSIETFVESIYQNLFRRDAEPGGLNYWTDRILGQSEQPQIALEDAILNIMQGASGNDQIIMANKVSAGITTVELMRALSIELPIETLRAVMDTVTTDPDSVDTAVDLANPRPDTTPVHLPSEIELEAILEDQPQTLDLDSLLAGFESSGWSLSALTVLTPTAGEVVADAEGIYTFTPTSNWFGKMQFEATLTTDSGQHTIILNLNVQPINDAPIARHDFISTLSYGVLEAEDTINLLSNDEDIESDQLYISAVNGNEDLIGTRAFGNNGGAFTINADGSFSFEPMGQFGHLAPGRSITTAVTYEITDSGGETATASASVTVTGALSPTSNPTPTPDNPDPESPTTPDDSSPSIGDTFNIDFSFDSGARAYAQVFERAAARLESIITQGLSDVEHSGSLIDDVLINASVAYIDGVGGTLGSAGPEYIRPDNRLPYLGSMTFDSSDMASMASDGSLSSVILHEMIHVLGFGTLWSELNLTNGAYYTGSSAVQVYKSLSGSQLLEAIPLTTGVGPGSDYSHWDEDTFDRELMTPFISSGQAPLSVLTIAALEDLGYSVNYSAADSYSLFG